MKCLNCNNNMDMECGKNPVSKEPVYWWECDKCNHVYDYELKNLLFIKND